MQWYEAWGWDTPWPEQGRNSRPRNAWSTGEVGQNCPRPERWPEQGQKDPVVEALLQLQKALGMKNRWDSRSFRSQLRRNIRRLCERERIPVPQWWEGGDLSTHQYKMRAHQFVNELLDAKLKAATGGQDSGAHPRRPLAHDLHHKPLGCLHKARPQGCLQKAVTSSGTVSARHRPSHT